MQGNGHRFIGGSGNNSMGVWQGGGGTLIIEDLILENAVHWR